MDDTLTVKQLRESLAPLAAGDRCDYRCNYRCNKSEKNGLGGEALLESKSSSATAHAQCVSVGW